MDKKIVFDFMNGESLAVVGSVSREGRPQCALIGIAVTPDVEVIFDTLNTTRKYANFCSNPAASLVVGTGVVSVQYEGVATELRGEELVCYQEIYFAKWPDGPSRLSWPGICYFVVRPRWLRYCNYTQRPPQIEEISF
jgi:hypothetical protein